MHTKAKRRVPLRRLLVALAALVAACDDAADPAGPSPPTPPTDPRSVSLAVDVTNPGARIGEDFLGLGFEMPVMADPRLTDDPVLERLLASLGPGTIRFGGNSVERTTWSPHGRHRSGEFFQLTPADVDATFAFARRIGWRVTVTLNLARFDPVAAADEAAYLSQRGGAALLAVEIGNEPNLYALEGYRPGSWNQDSFTVEFERYAEAIRARTPAVPLAGPATWCVGGGPWFASFLDQVSTPLAFATHHFYPMGVPAPSGSAEHATLENMLSPELMARTRECLGSAATPAAAHGLALRVDETNSAYGFGEPGVSDVFASALWGVDHLFTIAELGAAGVNLQMGTSLAGGLTCAGVYLPVCAQGDEVIARPLYYAMLFFHHAANGRLVPVSLSPGAGGGELNVAAHATLGDDGTVRVTIINKEAATPIAARIRVDGSMPTQAFAYGLAGPSLEARTGTTFAGAEVARDGTWTPAPAAPIQSDDGVFELAVPAASAVLLVAGENDLLASEQGNPAR